MKSKPDKIFCPGRILVVLICWVGIVPPGFAETSRIAVAASLRYVMTDIRNEYRRQNGDVVELVFGSSKSLAQQIVAGAPFEVFLSADLDSIKLLQTAGLTQGMPVAYGVGQLVLFKPKSSKLTLAAGLRSLLDFDSTDSVHRIAMADPETAPYGRAAKQALVNAGLFETIQSRLVIGVNALQAAQFAISGSVDAALIPYVIANNPRFIEKGNFVAVDNKLYHELVHQMVLIKRAGHGARDFMGFLSTVKAGSVFKAHGL